MEEPACFDDPLASRGARDHVTAERQQHGGQLRGGVRMGEAAANRAAVSDHTMRDEAYRGADERADARDEIRILDGRLARERLHHDSAVALIYPIESGNAVDIHDVCGAGEAEVQESERRLAAGEHLRVL